MTAPLTETDHAGCAHDTAGERYLCGELRASRDEAAWLREALRPFAAMADGKDSWPDHENRARFPTMKQVRAARAALTPKTGETK